MGRSSLPTLNSLVCLFVCLFVLFEMVDDECELRYDRQAPASLA